MTDSIRWSTWRRVDRNVVGLFLLSVTMTVAWSLTRPITFTTDSTTYVQLAEFFGGQRSAVSMSPIIWIRTPAYPLMMIATGVVTFKTFIGLLFVQALMAIAMPLIAYWTVAYVSKPMALAAGLLITLSLMPQIHSRSIMTEQAFTFGYLVLAYLVVRFGIERTRRLFWWLIGMSVTLALLRPSANFVGYLVVAATICVEPKHWRRALVGALVFFAITALWSSFAARRADPRIGGNLISRIFTGTPSFAGQQLFYDAYVAGQYAPDPNKRERGLTFSADNGPASARLLGVLTQFAEMYPQFWKTHPLARTSDDAKSFVERLRSQPTQMAFGYMWSATDTMLGATASSRLFRTAGLEAIAAHPAILLILVDNFVSVLFGPMAPYSPDGRLVLLPTIQSVTFHDPGLGPMDEAVHPYLTLPQFSASWESEAASYIYGFSYVVLKPLLFILIIATFSSMLASSISFQASLLGLIVLGHHAVTAVFAEHYARYVDQILPLTVVLAAMGLVTSVQGHQQVIWRAR